MKPSLRLSQIVAGLWLGIGGTTFADESPSVPYQYLTLQSGFHLHGCSVPSADWPKYLLSEGGYRTGWEPGRWRDFNIRKFIRLRLRENLQKTLNHPLFFGFLESTTPALRPSFRRLIDAGLVADIARSPYRVVREAKDCSDYAGSARAATADRIPGGEICFATRPLADFRKKFCAEGMHEDVLALALHEHAHHFKVLDANQSLYRAMAEAVETFQDLSPKLVPHERKVSREFLAAHDQFLEAHLPSANALSGGRQFQCGIVPYDKVMRRHHRTRDYLTVFFHEFTLEPDVLNSTIFFLRGGNTDLAPAHPRTFFVREVSGKPEFTHHQPIPTAYDRGEHFSVNFRESPNGEWLGQVTYRSDLPEDTDQSIPARPDTDDRVSGYLRCR